MNSTIHKLIDIGVNLNDEMYNGIYHSKQVHINDVANVLYRAQQSHVHTIILTSGDVHEIQKNIDIIQKYQSTTTIKLYTTVGLHPTRSSQYPTTMQLQSKYLDELREYIMNYKQYIICIGECGLDYDRLQYSTAEQQKSAFIVQLQLASECNLPLFLHNRNTNHGFIDIIEQYKYIINRVSGVVHSYTGTLDELNELLQYNLYIGVNGCSLKTHDNLNVVSHIPLDRLLIETDAPWCTIKQTHAAYQYVNTHFNTVKKNKYIVNGSDHDQMTLIKDRNEPCTLISIVQVLSKIRNESIDDIVTACYNNTCKLFFPSNSPT